MYTKTLHAGAMQVLFILLVILHLLKTGLKHVGMLTQIYMVKSTEWRFMWIGGIMKAISKNKTSRISRYRVHKLRNISGLSIVSGSHLNSIGTISGTSTP